MLPAPPSLSIEGEEIADSNVPVMNLGNRKQLEKVRSWNGATITQGSLQISSYFPPGDSSQIPCKLSKVIMIRARKQTP